MEWYGRDSPAQHRAAPLQNSPNSKQTRRDSVRGHDRRDLPRVREQGHPAARHFVHDHEWRVLPADTWFFLYVVPERHCRSWRADGSPVCLSLSPRFGLVSAVILSDSLAVRYGLASATARAVVTLPLAGFCCSSESIEEPHLAVAAFSLAFAGTEMTEEAYSAATAAAAAQTYDDGLAPGRDRRRSLWRSQHTAGRCGSGESCLDGGLPHRDRIAIVSGVLWFWIDGGRPMSAEIAKATLVKNCAPIACARSRHTRALSLN